ncbi:MAG TPA: hypothetical protein VF796_24395 [Humisphaera sp.]
MSVTVDHESLSVDQLGLTTVGQLLAHLQRDNRLVVNLLIDGEQPDLRQLGRVRASPLAGHVLYVETAEPQAIALDVLDEVEVELDEAERLKGEVVDLLQQNQPAPAFERMSRCFTAWNAARESIQKVTQLLRLDVERIRVGPNVALADTLTRFADHLRQLKDALEARDFVTLADVLAYEMTETTAQWRQALAAVRRAAGG